jgi:hypothetical protein
MTISRTDPFLTISRTDPFLTPFESTLAKEKCIKKGKLAAFAMRGLPAKSIGNFYWTTLYVERSLSL